MDKRRSRCNPTRGITHHQKRHFHQYQSSPWSSGYRAVLFASYLSGIACFSLKDFLAHGFKSPQRHIYRYVLPSIAPLPEIYHTVPRYTVVQWSNGRQIRIRLMPHRTEKLQEIGQTKRPMEFTFRGRGRFLEKFQLQ